MKPLIFFFFLIFSVLALTLSVTLIPTVSAVGFSPSSITFELQPLKEECQSISISSDSEHISVSDVWAENYEDPWSISDFNTPSSQHGILMDYPSSLNKDQRQVDVCVSGSNPGEYHGAIIFRLDQEGNSIIQLAVWIKAIIQETSNIPKSNPTQASSSGSSGGGSSTISSKQKNETIPISPNPIIEPLAGPTVSQNNLENKTPNITSQTISESKISPNIRITLLIFFIIAIVGILILNRRKTK